MSINFPYVEGISEKNMAYSQISQNKIHFMH